MPPKRASSRGERSRAAANDSGGGERSWAHDQAVSLLNDAKLSGDASGKCAKLKELAELVLRKEPELLGEFLEPMLEMRVDPNATVRKTIATLCEQIAVAHSSHLAACVSAARGLLGDAAPVVVKTATKAATAIFREALIESAMRGEGPRVPKEIKQTWKSARALVDDAKGLVLDEKTNDGVRLQAVKFLETVILLYHGRDWGSGVVSHGHATIDLDALGAEADGIIGVLLESLKPDVCAKQAGTVTLVMIGVAANVSAKLPVYFDFVLPSLVELAEANAGTDTANAASTAKELRNALLAALRSGASEVDAHESSLTTTLRDVLGAGDEVDAWRRQAERAAAKKREREQRAEELEAKRRRAADERDGASNGGGDVGGGGGGRACWTKWRRRWRRSRRRIAPRSTRSSRNFPPISSRTSSSRTSPIFVTSAGASPSTFARGWTRARRGSSIGRWTRTSARTSALTGNATATATAQATATTKAKAAHRAIRWIWIATTVTTVWASARPSRLARRRLRFSLKFARSRARRDADTYPPRSRVSSRRRIRTAPWRAWAARRFRRR